MFMCFCSQFWALFHYCQLSQDRTGFQACSLGQLTSPGIGTGRWGLKIPWQRGPVLGTLLGKYVRVEPEVLTFLLQRESEKSHWVRKLEKPWKFTAHLKKKLDESFPKSDNSLKYLHGITILSCEDEINFSKLSKVKTNLFNNAKKNI